MKRRTFLTGTAATTGGLAAGQGWAHPSNALPTHDLPEEMLPKWVPYVSAAYVIHVDPNLFTLYWTFPSNRALRFIVGVGRPGLYEAGEFYVGAKKEWPSWTPTPGMLRREPEKYAQYADGLPGGLNNPLGARALYLFTSERGDTFLRIHGTNDPSTLGRRVSNGCARLVNDQIVDLYDRVPLHTRVVLHPPEA